MVNTKLFQLTDADIGYKLANPLPEMAPRLTTRCIPLMLSERDNKISVMLASRVMDGQKVFSLLGGGIDCQSRGAEIGHDRDVFETEEGTMGREVLEESGYSLAETLPFGKARAIEERTHTDLLGTKTGLVQHTVCNVSLIGKKEHEPQLTQREIDRQQKLVFLPYEKAMQELYATAQSATSYQARFVGLRDYRFMQHFKPYILNWATQF